MTWLELEKIFNRALSCSFSKRKCLFVFPLLALCGLISVVCRALSLKASQWMQMSLTFLPIFLCAGLLMAGGLVLIKIYHDEVRGRSIQVFRAFMRSRKLFLGIPYLALPLIFSYLILWIVLGLFYLLRGIPQVGEFLGSMFSFGPFLLVLGSMSLGLLSFLILFFVIPSAALEGDLHPQLAKVVLNQLKENPFLSFFMPLIALSPLLIVVGFLSLAAVLTQILYVEGVSSMSIVFKWFFTMLPFCALLTPAVIFFFNFSAETHVLFRKALQVKK